MRNNFLFKIFIIAIISFFSVSSAFAANNTLKKISIKRTDDNTYTLSMFFKNDYKDKAFLQKSNDGGYYIYLPHTSAVKNVKYTYKNRHDKSRIKLSAEDKTNENSNFKYTRVAVNMDSDYTIKLIPKKSKDFSGIFLLITLAALFGLIVKRKNDLQLINPQYVSGNYSPSPLKQSPRNGVVMNKKVKIPPIVLPVSEINQALKFGDKSSFDCFNIDKNSSNNNTYNFKSTLNQTSQILNNKNSYMKLKHTNPIKQSVEQYSELSMPVIEEKKEQPIKKPEKKSPEVLSVLKKQTFFEILLF